MIISFVSAWCRGRRHRAHTCQDVNAALVGTAFKFSAGNVQYERQRQKEIVENTILNYGKNVIFCHQFLFFAPFFGRILRVVKRDRRNAVRVNIRTAAKSDSSIHSTYFFFVFSWTESQNVHFCSKKCLFSRFFTWSDMRHIVDWLPLLDGGSAPLIDLNPFLLFIQ